MSRDAHRMGQIRRLTVWVMTGVLQWPWLVGLIGGRATWLEQATGAVLLSHLASIVLIWCLWEPRGRGWHRATRGPARWAALLVAVLPVVGWIGLGWLTWLWPPAGYRPTEHDLDHEPSPDALRATPDEPVTLPGNDRVLAALDFLPLADILVGGDIELKRGAIERLERLRTPEAIALLQQHRGDASPDVRFYISAALERIRRSYEETLEAARYAVQRGPVKASAQLYLARTYLECARLGLFDPATTQTFAAEARFHAEAVAHGIHLPLKANWFLVDLYTWQHAWPEAARTLRTLEARPDVDRRALLEHQAHVAYAQGDFTHLRRTLSTYRHLPTPTPEWQTVLQWWSVEVGDRAT